MKRRCLFLSVLFLSLFLPCHAEEPQSMTETAETLGEYTFSLYVLCKHNGIKGREMPDYGFTGIKSFPLRVKEYTFSARYIDKMNDKVKAQALKMQLALPEKRQKNAYHLASSVFDFLKNSVSPRKVTPVALENQHKAYYPAHEVLEKMEGSPLEKLRLAVALMRSYQIPARIAGYRGGYAMEYYIKPIRGKSGWYVMDIDAGCLTCNSGAGYEEAVEWYPVDKNELLSCEIREGRAYLEAAGYHDICINGTDNELEQAFDAYAVSGIEPKGFTACARKSIIIRRYDYKLYLPENLAQKVKVDLTLPFNNREIIKNGEDGLFVTGRYAVKAGKGLKVTYKRAHTRQNPPQDGMVYYLTSVFEKEQP